MHEVLNSPSGLAKQRLQSDKLPTPTTLTQPPLPNAPRMQIDSVEDLIEALRTSGLFPPEQLDEVLSELAPLSGNTRAIMRHLVDGERISVYQLRKVIHGKAADLFIGPYVVIDKLGQGGMGEVFRARHTGIDRPAALKVVHPTLIT